jgi:group I intron endonuclease
MTEKINRYHKGKIYKIVNGINDDIYIGSTVKQLSNRMSGHRSMAKLFPDRKVYITMNEIGISHFKIILVEEYKCDNIDQLRAREDYFIQLMKPNLNTYAAILNEETDKERKRQYRIEYRKIPLTAERINKKKEYNKAYAKTEICKTGAQIYRAAHKNETKERNSIYQETHKEERKEYNTEYYKKMIYCEACKQYIKKYNKTRHERNQKHINNL